MEEIKFRVFKRDISGKMVLLGYERLTDGLTWERKTCSSDIWVKGVFGKGLRNRFSGYFDKNENEIYEGDILKIKRDDYNDVSITCRFGHALRSLSPLDMKSILDIVGFYFEVTEGKKTFPFMTNYLGKHDCEIMEIIGNIYENT